MPILVKCPQCQKAYTLSDEKRGKQIRCKDCFQVFHAGKPPADAPVMEVPSPAVSAPKPSPKSKPAVAVKTAPKPAAVKPAPKPAPKRAAPAAAPQSFADLDGAATGHPTTAKYRRRRYGVWIMALMVLFLIVMLGGGGTVGVLAYLGKLPFNLSAIGIGESRHAANAPPAKDGAAEPTPKPDNPDPSKPDQPDAAKPDKPKEPPNDKLSASVTKENFNKIDKGMTKADLFALMGPPSENRGESFVWNSAEGKILVTAPQGKVISKGNTLSWPVVYPGDAAIAPPPNKPTGGATK